MLKCPLALAPLEYHHTLALEEGQEVVWRLAGTLLSPSLQWHVFGTENELKNDSP